ncbi:MAG: hypothetical protein PHX13_12515 [Thiovulaceae bacterium]|nr:hypothetical protein [Sulfurimonadaceae bacterium]
MEKVNFYSYRSNEVLFEKREFYLKEYERLWEEILNNRQFDSNYDSIDIYDFELDDNNHHRMDSIRYSLRLIDDALVLRFKALLILQEKKEV